MRALETPGKAASCASAMCTSESQISKLKNEQLPKCSTLLALLNLKIVPTDYVCVDPSTWEFLKHLHAKVTRLNPDLLWRPDT